MSKKIILQHLCAYLDKYLNVPTFTDYCPNGLQVEGKKEIHKMAVAVSCSLEAIEKCIEENVDVLIVHHGIFWKGDSFVLEGAKKEKLRMLLENGISLLAYHLPLDAHKECGNNWRAAHDLKWRECAPFTEIGVQGKIKPVTFIELKRKLEKYYGHKANVAKGGDKKIERVALISGGAYRELKRAALAGIDAFITGNFDEPAWWVAKEEGIHFFALGHTATERVGPIALGKHLQKHFHVPTLFLDSENPF